MKQIESIKRIGLEYNDLINAALFIIGGKTWIIKPTNSYYFIVKGDTPLEVAQQLYKHPVGCDIRVNGNCTRPKPEGFEVQYYDRKTGKRVVATSNEADYDRIINDPGISDKQKWIDIKDSYIFSDDNTDTDKYIELYHIDSELGLYVFLEHLGNYYDSRKM